MQASEVTLSENIRYMDRPAAAVAERVLGETFGGPVKLGAEEPLRAGTDSKPNVRRCRVEAGPAGCPGSVVVKRIIGTDPYDPADVRPSGGSYGLPTMAWRLLAEWSAARFLGDLAGDGTPAPRCWGGDLADGVVVLEDLGLGETLRHLLLGSDPERAARGLLAYADALGGLHAATVGREAEYERLWAELGAGAAPGAPRAREAAHVREQGLEFRDLGERLGLSATPGLEGELAQIAAMLADPGPFLALAHVENQPINTHVAGGAVRLFDFEYSRYFPCLMDGMFRHLFPWTCHRLPTPVLDRMETAYRARLAQACPEAADDAHYGRGYLAGRAVWTIRATLLHLSSGAWESDPTPVDHSVHIEDEKADSPAPTSRQRVLLLLERFAVETAERGHLPALGDLCGKAAASLRASWATEPFTLPLYPAFRSEAMLSRDPPGGPLDTGHAAMYLKRKGEHPMADEKKTRQDEQIRKLPEEPQELKPEEAEKVQGGAATGGAGAGKIKFNEFQI